MADATLDAVERVLDEVDKSRDVDWSILGERLRSAILDSGEHVDAGFTEAQKAAIVAVCRETYYAASVVARAYAFKAVEALLERRGRVSASATYSMRPSLILSAASRIAFTGGW